MIVAGTNDARRAINALVRAGLSLPNGQAIVVLNNVDMTRAELRSAQSYEPGQIVVPQRSYSRELIQGEQLRVVSHDITRNTLTVEREGGQRVTFDPARNSMLRLYEKETVDLAPGDWVRVTANDKGLGVCNGERYQVGAVEEGHVVLQRMARSSTATQDIRIERRRPMHLQHGYATTIHSAQGLTRSRVLVDANTKSLTSNRAVFYVAISRARNHITLFTDDASKLATAMSREPKKFAALDLRDGVNEAALLRERVDGAARTLLVRNMRIRPRATSAAPSLHKMPSDSPLRVASTR
jgi:UvrD-like helicase family protein